MTVYKTFQADCPLTTASRSVFPNAEGCQVIAVIDVGFDYVAKSMEWFVLFWFHKLVMGASFSG